MNFRNFIILCAAIALFGSPGMAQDKKFEFSPFLGFTASNGVDVDSQDLGNGLVANRISPKSSFSWGLDFDYFLTENISVGFLWSQQMSDLRIRTDLVTPSPANISPPTPGDKDAADLNVYTYHGIFTYNFGDSDALIRPFVFGGLGATQYSPGSVKVEAVPLNGSSGNRELNGFSRFSTTWGGGVKTYVSDNLGFRFAVRWTPTYIKSDAAGIWCSPYWPWGCYVVGNDHFSHQAEFSGGVIFRF